MGYNTKYILPFNNDHNEFVEIHFDVLDYVGQIYTLIGDDDCLRIRATEGDEDKAAPIIGTECIVKIFVRKDDQVSIEDITAAVDNQIRITVFFNKNPIPLFQGFVVVEDNNQPFLDPPYTLQVRALDCLGLLKGVYFLDTLGNKFSGKMSIIGWLAQMLTATGQTLNLRTYFNISNASFIANKNPLEQIFIDAQTFGNSATTLLGDTNPADFNTGFDDYITALEKIVRNFRCKLFQENGYWNLVSIWESLNPNGYAYYEYSFGAPVNGIVPFSTVGQLSGIDYGVNIGKKEIVQTSDEDSLIYLKLATKSIEFTYLYDQSLNKIINQDLTQGARDVSFDGLISSSLVDPAITPVVNLRRHGYDLAGFDHFNGTKISGFNNPYPIKPATSNAFIGQIFDDLGYIIQRSAVLGVPPILNDTAYIRSSKLQIDKSDVLQFSVDYRFKDAFPFQVTLVVFAYLYGDDGTFWAMDTIGDGTTDQSHTIWQQCTDNRFYSALSSGGNASPFCAGSPAPANQWNNLDINSSHKTNFFYATAPVSGNVELIFSYNNAGYGGELWLRNITITLVPYLQGAYQSLKGDYNYSSSNLNILKTYSEDVQISDSPKRYFKGALVDSVSGKNLLSPTWFRKGYNESYRFTQLMEYIYYTHFGRQVYKIEGTMKGLTSTDNEDPTTVKAIGMLNTYLFIDGNFNTRRFMLTSFDKDYNTGKWRGVFVETLKDVNDTGITIPNSFIFDYIFQSA